MTDEEIGNILIAAMCVRTIQYAMIALATIQQVVPQIYAECTGASSERA